MKIIILGSGGVGGYYGGLLAQHGQQVTFVARGAHLEAMQREGLQVHSVHGDLRLQPVRTVASLAEAGAADLVLVCTKTHTTDAALQGIAACLCAETMVLSLQNGVDAARRIGAQVGIQHMLGGATWLSSAVEAPGVIRQVSQFRRVVIGELDGRSTPRLQAVAEAFRPTGITIEVTTEIAKVLWTKFVFISAVSGVGALTRLELGEFRHVPETRDLLAGLMGEVEALARAQDIILDPGVVEQTLAFVDASAGGIKPSMQRDVEAGRPFELEAILGVIGRLGRDYAVPTPFAEMVYASLLPVLLKAGGACAHP